VIELLLSRKALLHVAAHSAQRKLQLSGCELGALANAGSCIDHFSGAQ
jgi:hypothetical protein